MAALRELIIKISANSSSFQSEIARAQRTGSDFHRTLQDGGRLSAAASRQTQRAIADLNDQLATARSSALGLAGAFAGAFATHQLIQYVDTWNQMNGRLRLASAGADDYIESQRRLMEMSQRTGTALQANTNLYSRIAQSMRSAGYSSLDIAKVTETIGTSLKLSGASTEESSSVIVQLSQALGSGVLRGEEFNAVMENGQRLAKLLADGLGTTISGLRAMAFSGQLTTDKIIPLLLNVEQMRKEFAVIPATVSGSAQKIENAFMAWVGSANNAVSASSMLTTMMDGVANNINGVANAAGLLVGVGLARFFGNIVGSAGSATAAIVRNTGAEIALAQAQVRGAQVSVAISREAVYRAQKAVAAATSIDMQIAAERRLAAAQAGLSGALAGRMTAMNNLNNSASLLGRLGSGVLGILGGWPGIIIGAGAAMYGLYAHTQAVHKEAVAFADNLTDINSRLKEMSVAGLKSTAVDAATSLAAQKKDLAEIDEKIAKVKNSQSALNKIQQDYLKSPRLTYLNTFMDQADITAKNIELTGQLRNLEYKREEASSKVEATQKLVNDASELATQKAIEQAGAVSILKGAYELLNRTMAVTPGAFPGLAIDMSKLNPKQQEGLQKAARAKVLAGLDGLEKQHQQTLYEAQDLGLTGGAYTKYVADQDEADRKTKALADSKKEDAKATREAEKAEREAEAQAQRYTSKIEDLTIAIQVQKVRASEGEKAADLYAAAHQSGIKWTAGQTEEIRKQASELARWTSLAEDNVKKQREQESAIKKLTETSRKLRDEAASAHDTAGLSDRQKAYFDEKLEIDREFDKSNTKSAAAIAAHNTALAELDNKYRAIAESEANWRNGASKGYANWMEEMSNISGTVADGVKSSLDSAFSNVTSMLQGNTVSWKSWGISVLGIISKVALQMAVVGAMSKLSGTSGLFGSLIGGVTGLIGGGSSTVMSTTTGSTVTGQSFSVPAIPKFALGGVFDSPSLSAYSNGVYNTPQTFAFAKGAGIFGEAGPEAIMPLTRAADGSLGVRAVSSGVNNVSGSATTIHVDAPVTIVQDGVSSGNSSSDAQMLSSQIQSIVQVTISERLRKEISPGGVLYRS